MKHTQFDSVFLMTEEMEDWMEDDDDLLVLAAVTHSHPHPGDLINCSKSSSSSSIQSSISSVIVIHESRPVSVFMEDYKHKDSFNGQFFKST